MRLSLPQSGRSLPIATDTRRSARALAAVLLFLPVFFWSLPLLMGRVLITSLVPMCDQWQVNLPFGQLLAESLRAGQLPLWSERIGGGYPLLGVGEAGALYPFHLLYAFLPTLTAFNLSFVLALALAAFWMYRLCRGLGRSRTAAMLAAWAFTFSGFLVVHLSTVHSAHATAWAPALLLTTYRAARGRRAGAWVLVGVVGAVQMLTGYPQIAYYSALAAVLLVVWVRVTDGAAVSVEDRGVPGGLSVRRWAGLLLALAVAAGLTAAQWLPTWELMAQSERAGGLSEADLTKFTYPPANLLTFVAPYVFGNPARGENARWSPEGHFWDNGYIGLLPLALAFVGVAVGARRDRLVRFLLLLLVFSLLVVLGPHTPAFGLLRQIPGMGYFRFPSRFMAIGVLCLAALAAFGLDALRDGWPSRRRLLAGLALALTVLDLGVFVGRFHRFVDAGTWTAPPSTARFLRAQGDTLHYALGFGGYHQNVALRARGWMGDLTPFLEQKEMLAPNSGALYGLDSLNLFAGLETRRVAALKARLWMEAAETQDGERKPALRVHVRLPAVLAQLGVTHLVAASELRLPGMREVYAAPSATGGPTVRVYALENARPRLWVPDRVVAARGAQEALDAVLTADGAVIEGAVPGHAGRQGSLGGVETAAGTARARVKLGAPGYVIHNQRHYPGWSARVDGRPAPLLRANVLMQAVPVPAGEHTVEFRYESAPWRAGRDISLSTLALLGVAALGCLRSRGYSARGKFTRRPSRAER